MSNDADKEPTKESSGGVSGLLGIDQIDWGGEAGKFYECWKINPCCGSPDAKKMLCCLFCWCCCSCCSMSKLFASSVDQECALVPHCLMACFLPCITAICVRTNLRNRLGVQGNMVGDCICVWCCGCCSQCQELRSVTTEEWNLLEPAWKTPEVSAPEIIFLK
ncbi:putative transmembrane protein [Leptomonas pyrrhocoris]|uniref:Putative transmembrane protein n=1 Tax=Leptomonas pyrrhocoris TaxID=157538 RepID=A0A0M9FTX3_LEPPY|nr:putative transmembrane protein [Leptomonas pyrrhocoris]KPA75859.1 putative transmembrane protein [Leptomonas pyrrhocoris]|eukprot:XP_015654298.1 putative transmembrane protein [Leptomonas pyrrhocoris]